MSESTDNERLIAAFQDLLLRIERYAKWGRNLPTHSDLEVARREIARPEIREAIDRLNMGERGAAPDPQWIQQAEAVARKGAVASRDVLQHFLRVALRELRGATSPPSNELANQAWGFAFAALAPTRVMESPPPEWYALFGGAASRPDVCCICGGEQFSDGSGSHRVSCPSRPYPPPPADCTMCNGERWIIMGQQGLQPCPQCERRRASRPDVAPPDVTRVEIIDHRESQSPEVRGRAFVAGSPYGAPIRAELSYQDAGRTLKIFVTDRSPAPAPEKP